MNLIDISHVFSGQTPVYPGDDAIRLEKVKTLEADHFTSYFLSSGLHAGTHIDIPMHLVDDDRMVSDFGVDRFMGKGVLLDVRGQAQILMHETYEKIIPQDSVVLLYTGFDRHYGEDVYFSGHPVVSKDLCDFLLARSIKMLGMDMPSPDFPPFPCHKALLRNDVFILENVTNLQALLGATDFDVMAFPLKIAAEASFVRAVCQVRA